MRTAGTEPENLLPLDYDVFIVDYAGYGKSSGEIETQAQLFEDMQTVYDHLKKSYKEQDIIIIGYSIGTGLAAKLGAHDNPAMIVLQAPYYSMVDMMQRQYPGLPTFILDYKLAANEYLKKCIAPIYLFHGE